MACTEHCGSVIEALGSFGGMFDLSKAGVKETRLVSGTDIVGTKLMLTIMTNTIPSVRGCVAMCVMSIALLCRWNYCAPRLRSDEGERMNQPN